MKQTMTLEKQILDKIRAQGVRPLPKRVFQIRDLALWGVLGALLALLSIGFGMIILGVSGADNALFNKLGLSLSEKVAYSIPYLWIGIAAVTAGFAFANYRRTRRGYRTSGKQFALVVTVVAVTAGSVIYAADVAELVDRTASENIPLYNQLTPLNTTTWLDPERGLLSGVVRNQESNDDFMLRDADYNLWHVDASDAARPDGYSFSSGDRVKLIGTVEGDGEFKAIEIVPWTE